MKSFVHSVKDNHSVPLRNGNDQIIILRSKLSNSGNKQDWGFWW